MYDQTFRFHWKSNAFRAVVPSLSRLLDRFAKWFDAFDSCENYMLYKHKKQQQLKTTQKQPGCEAYNIYSDDPQSQWLLELWWTRYTQLYSPPRIAKTDKHEGLRDYMAIGFKCEAICPDCLNGRLSVRWDSHTLSLCQSDVVRNEQKNVFFL